MMYGRILIPLDGSSAAERALPYAVKIARSFDSEIELVHVHDPASLRDWTGFTEKAQLDCEHRAQAYLDDICQRYCKELGVSASVRVMVGDVLETLLERTEDSGVDMIVLTTHGRGPLSRFWIGSIADQLMRRVRIPLLIVRPTEKAVDPSWEPDLQRILIPLDGSKVSEQILEPALILGSQLDATYQLLNVVQFGREMSRDPFFLPPEYIRDDQAIADAQAYLGRVLSRFSDDVASRSSIYVESSSNVAQSIMDIGNPMRFDMIAMTTKGHFGLSRIMIGSVTDKVIRGGMLPVLLYRPTTDQE